MREYYGCRTCKSADKQLEEYIRALPMETSHHRVDSQDTKCGFGLQGVCCRLCSNGPCRITPEAPKGICGADATVERCVRAVCCRLPAAIFMVVENTAKNVRDIARSKGEIKGVDALNRLAEMLDITEEDMYLRAEKVAQAVLDDLHRPEYETMKLLRKMSYGPRYETWETAWNSSGRRKSGSVQRSSKNLYKLKFRPDGYAQRLFEAWDFNGNLWFGPDEPVK